MTGPYQHTQKVFYTGVCALDKQCFQSSCVKSGVQCPSRFWLVEQRTENPLQFSALDSKSLLRLLWFESTSERTMNECGKSSSIVVLLLIDSGFGQIQRRPTSLDLVIHPIWEYLLGRQDQKKVRLTEDVKKSTALALHKGIPDSVNSLVDIETKSH